MHFYVFAQRVIVVVVAIANVEGAIGILVEEVVVSWFVGVQIGVEPFSVPVNLAYSHCGVRHVEGFKLVVFVASIKDVVAAMSPL